jgi:hypothetical protein
MIMDKSKAKTIIQNAVETTKPRWSQYDESWNNIDAIFIYRGYEQQGFQVFKLRPVLEELNIFSIDKLGSILLRYPQRRNYDRQFAGSLTSEFYSNLHKGVSGSNGELFVEAIRLFLDNKIGNPGRTFWKLLYQMLQGYAYLKQNYSSSFGKYVLSKYAAFKNEQYISENDFLKITVSDWELFLSKAKPWNDLMGIGPNVFDFLFGDIVEAHFVENSYKFDSSNQHFLMVTGISRMIVPFNRSSTSSFLKELELPFNLREINKGIYTYCSKTESANYGFCRDIFKCKKCNVNAICDKEIQVIDNKEVRMLDSQEPILPFKPHSIPKGKYGILKKLTRLSYAMTFKELSDFIKDKSNSVPTNYMDLLLLENDNKKLSEILTIWGKYPGKNNDFKNVPRLKAHIRHRENHDGWIFDHSGDPDDPIVRLIGLK